MLYAALALSTQILVSVEGVRLAKAPSQRSVWPTAAEVLGAMGRGINLGNVYDAARGQVWNDPSFGTQAARLDALHAAGFTNVRVPVTWGDSFQWDDRTRDANRTVRYAIQKGFYVLLDTHHEHWLKDHYDGSSYYDGKFAELWRNIATLFQDVGPELVFEALNEPEGTMGWWSGPIFPSDPVAIARTRQINKVGYDAIRSVSPNRVVLVSPNGQGNQGMASTIYPNRQSFPDNGGDPYLGITVHTYDPWDFCGQTGNNGFFGSVSDMRSTLQSQFQGVFDWIAQTNIPTHLGEYGAGRLPENEWQRDTELVREYYSFVTNLFIERGIPTSVWDDQGWFSIMKGTNQFVYGLQDSLLNSSSPSGGCCMNGGVCSCGDDGTGWCNLSPANCGVCTGTWDPAGAAPDCSSPAPSPAPGGGCCRNGGECSCGNDGTGWCNDSPANCNVCTGTWDPAAAAPTCNGGGGGCCRNGDWQCSCGSDGSGWCNDSPSNCNVCTGTWDSNAPTPSC